MHLKFISMHIENFMSFEDATVSFGDTGYTIVSGRNENPQDGSRSNGSGKSSLWEAISWALTGSTIRGCKNVSNMFIEGSGALVEINFSVDNKHYRLIRSKDHTVYKTNLQIFIDDVCHSGKGIRESEVILSQMLPDLTSDLIGSVIILGQGLPNRLSSRTPAGRKELLEKLTKSDFMIEDIKKRLASRKEALTAQKAGAQNTLARLCGQQESLQKEFTDLQNKLNQYNLQDWEEQKKTLSIEYDLLQQQATQLGNQLQALSQTVAKSNSEYEKLFQERECKNTEIHNRYSPERNELEKRRIDLLSQIRAAEKTLNTLNRQPGVCPTCGQPLPVKVEVQRISEEDIATIRNQLAVCENDLESLRKREDDELSANLKSTSEKMSSLTAEMQDATLNRDAVQAQLNTIQHKILTNTASIATLKTQISNYYTELDNIDKRCTDIKNELSNIQGRTLYYNDEVSRITSRLDVVNKMITISTRDFRGYLLENVIEYLESVMRSYCATIFNHSDLSLTLDGTALDIKCCGKSYEALSGGERQKVDFITQLAIRQMLCKLMDFDSNILILDEIFDSMDNTSCQKIVDFISTNLDGIDSVYIITHHSDLQIPFDHEITVCKDSNNISRIM